jgi:hypothetical protein
MQSKLRQARSSLENADEETNLSNEGDQGEQSAPVSAGTGKEYF